MKLLLDIGETKSQALPQGAGELVLGQLLTPLTGYARWADVFAVDNGAYTKFRADKFRAILEREWPERTKCLWVAVPDVVGSARRTLEVWQYRYDLVPNGWPLAFVAQDGAEHNSIPWDECAAVFIGGTTHWKMSLEAAAIVKAAKILGKHVHVGRINTARRWNHFEKLGADTTDGSGFARYDWMLKRLIHRDDAPLFESKSA
jgi:hypothetical protein